MMSCLRETMQGPRSGARALGWMLSRAAEPSLGVPGEQGDPPRGIVSFREFQNDDF